MGLIAAGDGEPTERTFSHINNCFWPHVQASDKHNHGLLLPLITVTYEEIIQCSRLS